MYNHNCRWEDIYEIKFEPLNYKDQVVGLVGKTLKNNGEYIFQREWRNTSKASDEGAGSHACLPNIPMSLNYSNMVRRYNMKNKIQEDQGSNSLNFNKNVVFILILKVNYSSIYKLWFGFIYMTDKSINKTLY